MDWSAPKYLTASAVALGLVLIAAEAGMLHWSRLTAMRALKSLEQKKQERDWLARQSPALSPENEAAIKSDLVAADRLQTELRPALQGRDPGLFDSPSPAKPVDAFFELAAFVERLRIRASQAQVVLRPDERFGFATYANEGPATDTLAAVHCQRLVAQHLIETLLESHPLVLLAVRRERPVTGGPRDQRERADDFFELDRSLSLRQPGEIAGEALRLEFTGQTETLRNFLNRLATFRQPIVVCSIEVEPLTGSNLTVPAGATGAPIPLVARSLSKFVVTAEFVRPADSPVTATP